MAIPYVACMALVAQLYHLPPRVLPSIQVVEGGSVGSVSSNRDGSQDLGVMQVNTLWIAPLAQLTRLPPTVVRDRLIGWPCFNIAAAGAIFRAYLNEAHGDLLLAVGYYHSHTPALRDAYRELVIRSARVLFERQPAGHPR
jgi:hypothetical protein